MGAGKPWNGYYEFTCLDIYVPSENVTISYMHGAFQPEHQILFTPVRKGQLLGTESDNGALGNSHTHIEINEGCCCLMGNIPATAPAELSKSITQYYDGKLKNEKQLLQFLNMDYRGGHVKDISGEKKECMERIATFTQEKNEKSGNAYNNLLNSITSPAMQAERQSELDRLGGNCYCKKSKLSL